MGAQEVAQEFALHRKVQVHAAADRMMPPHQVVLTDTIFSDDMRERRQIARRL
jgi:hypothetical protein